MICFILYLFYYFFVFTNVLSTHFPLRENITSGSFIEDFLKNSDKCRPSLPLSATIQLWSDSPLWTSLIGLNTPQKWYLEIFLKNFNRVINMFYVTAFFFANAYNINNTKRKKLTRKRKEITQANTYERLLYSSVSIIELTTNQQQQEFQNGGSKIN